MTTAGAAPVLSVIIPFYNRADTVPFTLASVARARVGLTVETILIDDGSTPPAAEQLRGTACPPDRIIRQENQGLLFARLAGLRAATGDAVLFLDSDDLVSPEKFTAQLAAMHATGAAVSYSDTAHCVLGGDRAPPLTVDSPAAEVTDSAAFHLLVQPAPHSPIYRRDYLDRVVRTAVFPPSPLYNPVAEIWFYHNAALHPARVVHVPGPHTIIGSHAGARLTNHWEKLAVASLAVMEAFARTCPTDTPAARQARQLVGERAFGSWRRLPRGFSPEFARRTLALWHRLADGTTSPVLGGRLFRSLARVLGPVGAARVLHRFQAGPYAACRTLDDGEFARLLSALPPA